MSKSRRYIFSFVFTLVVLGFLWMYNLKTTEISDLKTELKDSKQELDEVKAEYQACKGELYHKQKKIDMANQKINRIESDSSEVID